MELASKYNPSDIESKWYQYWLDNGFFRSKPDGREPYTIVIPPPNVTGVLHMGHMLNNTIQDVLVRRARMQGKNACWVPGTDHASIATEAKVVGKLAAEGIKKTDLTRDEFLGHAWDWTHKHGGIILEQLKKLGASCDWNRTAFTMDEKRSESVIKVFCDLYNKGLIYRGVRMVNWDPKALTALSDEEVIFKEQQGKLFYLRYKIVVPQPPKGGVEGAEYLVVATTRPETIFGDVAICINPNNPKTAHLKGRKCYVPLINRVIPVIEDDYVDIEFGTGCLKVTPAHDVNDYILGEKYNLPSIDIFNDNGTLNENGAQYAGMDRFEVREQIVKDLEVAALLEKVEAYTNKIGYSERTDAVIEPKLSMQWFVKMENLAKPAFEAVMSDDIQLYPAKFKNTYRHWMENVKDWCVSRQLWWGHRIPAYYIETPLNSTEGGSWGYVVAPNEEKARELALAKYPSLGGAGGCFTLRQDEDVLDTWFSSWLWPISVFDGINNPENEDIKYYYPTNDLVTAPEIIFFWVARMIIAGYEYRNDLPFKNVYFTGIVRDKLGRKMSKSLGNSPDPLDLIAHYGADAVRLGMLLTSPAGNDLPYDDYLCEQGRNFNNKIWNAFRLVKGWKVADIPQPESARMAVKWFDAQLNKTLLEIDDLFSKYRLSEALMAVYKLFWDEFSAWYLEMAKPAYQQPIDRVTYEATLGFFDSLLKVLHPFMPFITEELWQTLEDRKEGESIMVSIAPSYIPEGGEIPLQDLKLITEFEKVKEIIAGIRTIRLQKNIPQKEKLSLYINGEHIKQFDEIIIKLCNLDVINLVSEGLQNPTTLEPEVLSDSEKLVGLTFSSFLIGTTEFSIPMGSQINAEEEIAKMEAEINYFEGFIESVMKKLGNERFVANAKPEVVEAERKKKADAESKIDSLKDAIEALKN
jgi:valyl-tRNA synthetase